MKTDDIAEVHVVLGEAVDLTEVNQQLVLAALRTQIRSEEAEAAHFLAAQSVAAAHFLAVQEVEATHFLAAQKVATAHFLAAQQIETAHFVAAQKVQAAYFAVGHRQLAAKRRRVRSSRRVPALAPAPS